MLNKSASNKRLLLGINFAFWLLITTISATQLYVRFQGEYDGGWLNFFWRQGVVWAGWAILTPFIFHFIQKIDRNDSKLKNGVVHFIYAILFTLTYTVILSTLSTVFFNSNTSFLKFLKQGLITGTAANLLVYALIAVFSLLLIFYQSSKEEKELKHQLDLEIQSLEKQLVTAQLNALKAQVQPHFLFNSLHSIASLIRKKELEKATDTIATLSDLLRTTLKNQDRNLISLEEEIDLITKYLDVEKIRFGDTLKIELLFDNDTLNIPVPAFILQPIIENCFKHAFIDQTDASLILRGSLDKNELSLCVEDNGKGLSKDFEDSAKKRVGIKNVKQRLESLYQESASLTLKENSVKGTIAQLKIPVQLKNNE